VFISKHAYRQHCSRPRVLGLCLLGRGQGLSAVG